MMQTANIIQGDYFAFDAVNASRLKLARKSLAHYFNYTPPKTTPAMEFGTLFHAAILEPMTLQTDFFVMERYDRRTKEGKAAHAEQEEAARGRQLITSIDLETCENMRDALTAHESFAMFQGEGINELPLTALDPVSGLQLKCKVDRLAFGKTGAIIPIDIKTTQDASPDGFVKACSNFDYAIQAALYDKIIKLAYPDSEVLPMRFIMIEKDAPHYLSSYQLDVFTMGVARDWIEATLLMIATTEPETVLSPYYNVENPMGLHIIDLPDYYLNKLR